MAGVSFRASPSRKLEQEQKRGMKGELSRNTERERKRFI